MDDGWRTFFGLAAVAASYFVGREDERRRTEKLNYERARDNEINRLRAQIAALERKIK